MFRSFKIGVALCGVCLHGVGLAEAAINIETVFVGNPGNAGEPSGSSAPGGHGPAAIVGAVDYTYKMGKYEVTAGQYTAFLNAVAATDTYGLYNTSMWSGDYGCAHIERSGSWARGAIRTALLQSGRTVR